MEGERGGGDIYYYKLLKQSRDTLETSLCVSVLEIRMFWFVYFYFLNASCNERKRIYRDLIVLAVFNNN